MPDKIIDFKFVSKVDTRQNFIIKCDDQDEFEQLCKLLKCKSKVISFQKFIEEWEKHC